jgi:hypothetical protein
MTRSFAPLHEPHLDNFYSTAKLVAPVLVLAAATWGIIVRFYIRFRCRYPQSLKYAYTRSYLSPCLLRFNILDMRLCSFRSMGQYLDLSFFFATVR